ncbi:angiogenic factor with G patch and FHA domains 1 [Octopus bimaculoides]|nr:angiogenic factor with G patch and FHA domains 1 [Octopus bimaculoides]|eukprot:XP_014773813.1 PREDICTED: angiogenic factor with G patch and FHA domains 1-like [Octopus bimaculoides]
MHILIFSITKDSAYVSNVEALKNPNYSDKASIRRKTVGSSNPYIENTAKAASVNEEIPSENKGRKMLEKLGWNPGECLGKSNQNITEPVSIYLVIGFVYETTFLDKII